MFPEDMVLVRGAPDYPGFDLVPIALGVPEVAVAPVGVGRDWSTVVDSTVPVV